MQEFFTAIEQWLANLSVAEQAPRILIATLILVLGLFVARFFKGMAHRALRYRKTDPELSLVLARLVQWSLITGAVLVSADQVGIDITALLTGLGILGFTLGFALQDVSKNFVAGLLILLQQPFELGDTIEVSGFTGTVLDINLRDTEMRTVDGLRVRIPNGDVFTSPILNYANVTSRRLDLAFGVVYGSDLDKVRQVAVEAIKSVPGVLDDPAIDFRFEAFSDYAIQVQSYYWYSETETSYSEALDGAITNINRGFAENEIQIAVPYQHIRVSEDSGRRA
jgi:small-conductance mechanosensitive channel